MENKSVNITPVGPTPVYNFSQNDNNRKIRCSLYDCVLVKTLTGTEYLKLYCLTPDKRLVFVDVANTSNTYVDIDIPNTLTSAAGKVYCKLHINRISAKAFYLDVEGRP